MDFSNVNCFESKPEKNWFEKSSCFETKPEKNWFDKKSSNFLESQNKPENMYDNKDEIKLNGKKVQKFEIKRKQDDDPPA